MKGYKVDYTKPMEYSVEPNCWFNCEYVAEDVNVVIVRMTGTKELKTVPKGRAHILRNKTVQKSLDEILNDCIEDSNLFWSDTNTDYVVPREILSELILKLKDRGVFKEGPFTVVE